MGVSRAENRESEVLELLEGEAFPINKINLEGIWRRRSARLDGEE